MPQFAVARLVRQVFPVALPLALVVVAGCSRTIDMEAVKKSIVEGLDGQLGMKNAAVSCPTETRTLKAGDKFECTAKPTEGGQLAITVSEDDDQGKVSWLVTKTEGLIDLKAVESSVQGGLKTQMNLESTVSCGGRWRAEKAGDSFECEAKTADGKSVTAVVTQKDGAGNISWATK